eukprot:SAG22_NODE_23_length_31399_cov_35.631313_15_plen_454_part_00
MPTFCRGACVQEEVRLGGFFTPPTPNFATAVGPPYPAKKPPGALQTPYNGESFEQQTWGNYEPQLFELLAVERLSLGEPHADGGTGVSSDRPIVHTGLQRGEVLLQGSRNGTLWRSTDGARSFERWCETPASDWRQGCSSGSHQACGSMGFGVLDDGTLLATQANTTHIRVHRGHYGGSKRGCAWESPPNELPSLLPGHTFAPTRERFTDLGGGRVLYPISANEEDGESYGLLYETMDYGRSWVARGMMGKHRSEMDVLSLGAGHASGVAGWESLVAAVRYQTSGNHSATMQAPLYKQTAVQFSSDQGVRACPTGLAPGVQQLLFDQCSDQESRLFRLLLGFTWTAPKIVTGYLQHTASIIKLSDGTLVLPFSHWPTVTQQRPSGQGNSADGDGGAGYGHRFIVSYDDGASWSNRIFSLHPGPGECNSHMGADPYMYHLFCPVSTITRTRHYH